VQRRAYSPGRSAKIIADLVIGFGPFQETFRSQLRWIGLRQVTVASHRRTTGASQTIFWTFTPLGDKTHVDFNHDFQIQEPSARHVANEMFYQAATRMMGRLGLVRTCFTWMQQRTAHHPYYLTLLAKTSAPSAGIVIARSQALG